MSTAPNRRGLVAGSIFVAIGVAFLGAELDWWTMRARYVLPLVLIAIGVGLLVGRDQR